MMRLEAIYDNGRLRFLSPVRFARERFRVAVEIPDQELLHPSVLETELEELDEYTREMLAQLDAIRDAPLPPDADLPPLSEKQIERHEAFALREDR